MCKGTCEEGLRFAVGVAIVCAFCVVVLGLTWALFAALTAVWG